MTPGSRTILLGGERLLIAAVILVWAPVLMIVAGWQVLLAGFWLAAVAAAILLVNPRWAFLLFLPAVGWYHPFSAGAIQLQLSDLLIMIVLLGTAFEWLWRIRTRIRISPFDLPFIALALATYISIPSAYSYSMTLTPALRIIFIYLSFRMVFKYTLEIGLDSMIRYYVLLVLAVSVYNVILFVSAGGTERVFGITWLTFESLSMTALPMGVAFMIHAQSWPRRIAWAFACLVIGAAILASGSRGTMLAVVLSIPVLVWAVSRGRGMTRMGLVLRVMSPLAILAVVTYLLRDSLLAYPVERLEALIASIGDAQGSVALRVVLWTAAVKAFLAHPITGIGIGNFRVVDMVLPQQHMVPVWYYIRGMSAHNTFLHYLAETGLVGGAALTFLAWRGARVCLNRLRSLPASATGLAVFMGMAVFVLSIFFMRAWTWGQDSYVMAFLFGIAAAWWHQKQ